MKKSQTETAETRRRIVQTAAAQFRSKGIHATGLIELMAAAGLTHGGFYRHFGSKDELVTEACAAGMAEVVEGVEAAASGREGKSGFDAIVEDYLSIAHRDNSSEGCPLVALGSELARADMETRAAATEGFTQLVDVIAQQSRRRDRDIARTDAIFALSAMVGAVTVSRIVTNPELSDSILRDVRQHLSRSRATSRSRNAER